MDPETGWKPILVCFPEHRAMTQGRPGVYSRHYPHQTVVKCPNYMPGTKCLKRPSKEPSRRVRYDRAQLIPQVFLVEMCTFHETETPKAQRLQRIFCSHR